MTTNDSGDGKSDGRIDYKDPETLRELYWSEGLTLREIGELAGGRDESTIRRQMKKHGIDRRGRPNSIYGITARYEQSPGGYMRWADDITGKNVFIHRLVAVSEYGFREVRDKHIHHRNGIPWDNRPENLTPMTPTEHRREHNGGEKSPHAKLTRKEAQEIKELATEGDLMQEEIASKYGIERSLVSMIKTGKRWGVLD